MPSKNDGIPRVVTRGLPDAVTYDLSTRGHVTITLPRGSTWTSGLHWHETHTEYLQVLQGSIQVQLGDSEQVVSATASSKPEVEVPRFVWHAWQRATPHDGDDVVVVERTVPADGEKSLFFWNLNGVILDAPRMLETGVISLFPSSGLRTVLLDFWVMLNLFVIFHHLDNCPVLVNFPEKLRDSGAVSRRFLVLADRVVTRTVLYLASWVGWLLNARPLRLKYTPAEEYAEWIARKNQRQAKDQ